MLARAVGRKLGVAKKAGPIVARLSLWKYANWLMVVDEIVEREERNPDSLAVLAFNGGFRQYRRVDG